MSSASWRAKVLFTKSLAQGVEAGQWSSIYYLSNASRVRVKPNNRILSYLIYQVTTY